MLYRRTDRSNLAVTGGEVPRMRDERTAALALHVANAAIRLEVIFCY